MQHKVQHELTVILIIATAVIVISAFDFGVIVI